MKKKEKTATPHEPKDNLREVVETIVFVVVLVLILKSFAAEAFVIPTGSMAETLYGYQADVTCPECGYTFPVNYSRQVDPQDANKQEKVTGCTCPNCRVHIPLNDGDSWSSGDRVLVAKFLYDLHLRDPQRFDIVVFKYPEKPQPKQTPMNYIKRGIGMPGETIGVYYGKLYVLRGIRYDESSTDPLDLWKSQYMHGDDFEPLLRNVHAYQKLFEAFEAESKQVAPNPEQPELYFGRVRELLLKRPDVEQFRSLLDVAGDGRHPVLEVMAKHQADLHALSERGELRFQILRKPPDKMLAMRRLVYDNDHQPKDLAGQPPRWEPGGGWAAGSGHDFGHPASVGDVVSWLRYKHRLRKPGTTRVGKPELITDFMGYNTYETASHHGVEREEWAGDLMLECDATVEESRGTFVLQLSRGVDRFEARWDLATGKCTLGRLGDDGKAKALRRGSEEPPRADTALGKPGTYRLRFANIDRRLTLWVNDQLVFGDGVEYDPPEKPGPTANDLEPASIGAQSAALRVDHLRLWRDTHYTSRQQGPDPQNVDWADPDRWQGMQNQLGQTYYVQPGHYLCLGDNSPESSDSRYWGTVPERLMLGRALLIYYPFARTGRIK
jgi:signal peptidase I